MLDKILITIFTTNFIPHELEAVTTNPKELANLNRFDLFTQQKSKIKVHKGIPHAILLENIPICEILKQKTSYNNNVPSIWLWEVNDLDQFRHIITKVTSCPETFDNSSRFQSFHFLLYYNSTGINSSLTDSETHFRQILHQDSQLFICHLSSSTGLMVYCVEIFLVKKLIHYQIVTFRSDQQHSNLYSQLSFLVDNIILRRYNFKMEKITGAVLAHEKYVYDEKFKSVNNSDSQVKLLGGINIEIYRYLRDSLNFSESAIRVNRGLAESLNGTLNNSGLAKVLNSEVADLSIPVFEYIPYRILGPHRIQFLHPMVMSRKAIAVFVQPPKSDVRNVYGRPYSTNIWIFAATLHLLEMLSLFVIISSHYKRINVHYYTLLDAFRAVNMWTFSLNTRQGDLGTDSPPAVTSLRLALFFGALCSTVLHAIYSSKLTSILAVDDDPVTNIQQLYDAQYWIYVNSNVPSLKQLAFTNIHKSKLSIDQRSLAIDPSVGISRVVSSKSALLTATDEFAYTYTQGQYTREYLCTCLSTVQLSQISIKSAQFVKHGSPLRNIFNVKLLLMLQSGVVKRHLPEYQRETSLSCKETSNYFVSMDLLDTFLPFAILIIAFGVSSIALVLERNWEYFVPRKRLVI